MLIRLYLLYLNKEFFFEWNIYTFNSIKFNFLLLIDYKSLIFIFFSFRKSFDQIFEMKKDSLVYITIRASKISIPREDANAGQSESK